MLEQTSLPSEWARQHFCGVSVGDKRLEQRVIYIAETMAREPGRSCPEMFPKWADLKAAYRFFDNPGVTPEEIQGSHRALVREQMTGTGKTMLLIEDTTDMIWHGHEKIEGLGPVGSGYEGSQGFMLHTTLCAKWERQDLQPPTSEPKRPPLEIVGLAEQEFYVRKSCCEEEKARSNSRDRKNRKRESQLWEGTSERIGNAPEGVRWVRVCDRGADIYEFLASCLRLGHGFIVRAAQDRVLVDRLTGQRNGKLFETGRAAAEIGKFDLRIRSRPGQQARTAHLSVCVVAVDLRAPSHSSGTLPPIPCTLVHVVENNPPSHVKEPIEWFLLCDQPIQTWEQALECVLQYTARWLIEDYHKALKTGMGAKNLQLEQAHRLFAAIAIMSVVALRLVSLREWVRLIPQASANCSGLSLVELQVLELAIQKSLHTVRDVSLAIGHLGGHLGRKNDPEPGLLVLWRGMRRLELLVQGFLLAQKKLAYG